MTIARTEQLVELKNILYLTDFSEPSERALPFAIGMARKYGAKLYSLHVFMPAPYAGKTPGMVAAGMEAEEEIARGEMQRIESQLSGLPHQELVESGLDVWASVEQAIQDRAIDLIVMGTHGRTGAERLLLGSVTEEVFRRAHVPVLTIGPSVRNGAHSGGRFRRVLFTTDFTPASVAAARYAVSLAQENEARLLLLHVMLMPEEEKQEPRFQMSVADVIHRLYEVIPKDAQLAIPAQVAIEYGNPAERIIEAARERGADVIVLGVRSAAGHLAAATHVMRATAHEVVAHALCPVLTVRGE
jgi:nucleotide-binding universal stress UspA family protein